MNKRKIFAINIRKLTAAFVSCLLIGSVSANTAGYTNAAFTPVAEKGDVTLDGKIDSRDASAILRHYAESSAGKVDEYTGDMLFRADYNSDSIVDSKDASAVLIFYAESSAENK